VKANPEFCGDEEPIDELFTDDAEAYYWALTPFFHRVEERCGLLIDQYGTTTFSPQQTAVLRDALREERQLVLLSPQTWAVALRTEVKPHYRELTAHVERESVLQHIDRLDSGVAQALNDRAYLIFSGD
jgi:hypothetical protein